MVFTFLALCLRPAQADLLDLIEPHLWASDCAQSQTRETPAWQKLQRHEWCWHSVGDFGRVHSACEAVTWTYMGRNRMAAQFDDGHIEIVEMIAGDRLSVFRDIDGQFQQVSILSRARHNQDIATHFVQCH